MKRVLDSALLEPHVLRTPEETEAFGVRLAERLEPGDLLVLSGPLGAGKTALARGIGRGLGVHGAITSPTFVLARIHRGPLPLVHVDAYRLREAGASLHFDDLDLDLALEDSVVVVEWGEGIVERLAASWLHVELERPAPDEREPDDISPRVVRVRPYGPRWSAPA